MINLESLVCQRTQHWDVRLYVDLIDFLDRIRRVIRVKVPADTELVAYIELDFLISEGLVDKFSDITLQTGHIAVVTSRFSILDTPGLLDFDAT